MIKTHGIGHGRPHSARPVHGHKHVRNPWLAHVLDAVIIQVVPHKVADDSSRLDITEVGAGVRRGVQWQDDRRRIHIAVVRRVAARRIGSGRNVGGKRRLGVIDRDDVGAGTQAMKEVKAVRVGHRGVEKKCIAGVV